MFDLGGGSPTQSAPPVPVVYTMHCDAGATVISNTGAPWHAVRCTGGNAAVLYFW
jgi:hypothetical protein